MVTVSFSIEEVEVVVNGVVVGSHACPTEEEVEQGSWPKWSEELLVDSSDPISLNVVLEESSVAVVEVKLLIVRTSRVSDETLESVETTLS